MRQIPAPPYYAGHKNTSLLFFQDMGIWVYGGEGIITAQSTNLYVVF
jgi:hypothetical protein